LSVPENLSPAPETAPSPEAEAFYENAYRRIVRIMLVLPILVFPVLLIKFHGAVAFGFIVGSAIAFFNFYWLKRAVVVLGDRVTNSTYRQSGSRVVAGFFMRYVLIGVGAYVIFKSSAMSVNGLFVGLFVPVGAVLIEAVYETYGALRRGF
jgi:nitrate reductase NapE component